MSNEDKIVHAKFDMSLYQRIRAANSLWWAVVVTGELDCLDDEAEGQEE